MRKNKNLRLFGKNGVAVFISQPCIIIVYLLIHPLSLLLIFRVHQQLSLPPYLNRKHLIRLSPMRKSFFLSFWRHLVLLGLAQSKPSGLARAGTKQSQAAPDGATGLV